MVRAKRGFFFDEFLREEFIAIGWNLLSKSTLSVSLTSSQSKYLKKKIKEVYNESKPGTALNIGADELVADAQVGGRFLK